MRELSCSHGADLSLICVSATIPPMPHEKIELRVIATLSGVAAAQWDALLDAPLFLPTNFSVSSLQILFPEADEAGELEAAGMMLPHGVQFVWHNAGYASFADFLASMSHDKRKKIKQERRKVAEA